MSQQLKKLNAEQIQRLLDSIQQLEFYARTEPEGFTVKGYTQKWAEITAKQLKGEWPL